ncbi:hypothetical protein [Pseudoduganella sp. R-34]|jgi:hypothetical protein|uniref:hypothetical protein n=1 Tax=Pseudoduganella sp. R-34 TaxID=3404062 RepID=UPI003CECFA22
MYQAEQTFRDWKNAGAKLHDADKIVATSKGNVATEEKDGSTIMRYADGSELSVSITLQMGQPVVRMIWGSP